MSSSKDLKECVLCGRRGVQGFGAADARSWRCSNSTACQRRIEEAAQERLHTPPAAQGAAGAVPEAALAGLAREVEALRTRVEAMSPLSQRVQTLHDEVAPLPAQVSKLAKVVKSLADQAGPDEQVGKTAPLSWLDLADGPDDDGAGAAQDVLTELSAWLVRVFLRYPDGVAALSECWWWHPDVVEELVCLERAWVAAYVDTDATVGRAADWHDHYRPGAVKRIRQATQNCSLEAHQASGERHRPGPQIPAGMALAPIAAWWGRDRASVAPEPEADLIAETRVAESARRRAGGARR
ncbi:hypothetical protein HFP15_30085 [Amycolatopsis sp. K13G38]|uniref:Recombinase zinc beta ribbon domain-containing protein n=1 Tax=Amycolatopsis acididurans TaxID=2724524 RepID=A0ABX1JBS2_9PSEU|nr:hypothetical protein [Amycolatopsis acididurans]NKQ57128.1 hypothetical protein [Amycolatopsis acididurans]